MKINLSGEDSPNWKGGRPKDSSGYQRVYLPGHPRANSQGYVYEHVLVAGNKIGKPIPKGFHVHHLNGIRDDNRPENLAVVRPKDHEHHTLKRLLYERIKLLESTLETSGIKGLV